MQESKEVETKKGMVFDILEHLKYFLMDYTVRFHMPYYVSHLICHDRVSPALVHVRDGSMVYTIVASSTAIEWYYHAIRTGVTKSACDICKLFLEEVSNKITIKNDKK